MRTRKLKTMENALHTPVSHTGNADTRGWTLTQNAFDGFLARLDSDRDRAGLAYEHLRTQLVRFFAGNSSDAERWADETLDRVMRKNQEQQIDDIHAFAFGVARRIRIEMHRRPRREVAMVDLSAMPDVNTPSQEARMDKEAQMAALKECCDEIPTAQRELLISWYAHSGREAITHRRRLSTTLGIPAVTLRVRAFRTREMLRGIALKHGLCAVA